MKPRILQIIPTLDRAGTQKQMCLVARGLPRDEFDVHVCALTRDGPLSADLQRAEVPVAVISKRWRVDPQAYWQLRRHVARLRPQLIHTWLFAASVYGHAVARACGVKSLVVGQRCIDRWKGPTELAVDRHVARRCSQVVAAGGAVRDFYTHHGLPREKMRVISNGIAAVDPASVTRRQLLAEFGLPRGSRLIGVLGRIQRHKRLKDAIWATDLLKVIRDDVHLLIIGDGPHRSRLRMFRDQVVIGDRVHFLGHRDDAERWLSHLDVLWSTSAYEGQSNSIMEAMAAGVPVVATDIPGTRDLVVPARTGYLVPIGDRAGFARQTSKLLEDPALARRLGQTGQERMRDEFSAEEMIQQHAELYRELLA